MRETDAKMIGTVLTKHIKSKEIGIVDRFIFENIGDAIHTNEHTTRIVRKRMGGGGEKI